MGRGNWFPGDNLEDCRVGYIDYSDDTIEADDTDLHQWAWQDARDTLLNCLPDSFIAVGCIRDLPEYCRTVRDRDSMPIAFNALYTVWVDGWGESSHLGIGFTVNDGAPGFARSRMDSVARAFFKRLNDCYPVRARGCAWTSAPMFENAPVSV